MAVAASSYLPSVLSYYPSVFHLRCCVLCWSVTVPRKLKLETIKSFKRRGCYHLRLPQTSKCSGGGCFSTSLFISSISSGAVFSCSSYSFPFVTVSTKFSPVKCEESCRRKSKGRVALEGLFSFLIGTTSSPERPNFRISGPSPVQRRKPGRQF